MRGDREFEFIGSIFHEPEREVKPDFSWQNTFRNVKWRDECSSRKLPLTESAVWFNNKIHIVDRVSLGLGIGNVIADEGQGGRKKRPLISILKGTQNLIQSEREKVNCDDFPDISWFFKSKTHAA